MRSAGVDRPIGAATRLVAGDRVAAAAGGLTLASAELTLRLGPGASVTLGPRIKLHRGSLLATGATTIETPAAEIVSDGGTFRVALDADARSEAMHPALSHLATAAAAAATTFLLVRALDGDATVRNAAGTTRVAAGEAGVVSAGEAPRVPAAGDDDPLRERLAQRDDTIVRLKAKIRELERVARTGDVAPRAPAEVEAAVRALAKEMGINAYTFLTPDAALMKELAALGPEGIKILSAMLRSGTDDERFVAAAMLEKLGDPSAVPALADLLFDPKNDNTLLQRMASHAMAIIGGEEAVGPLERVLEGEMEWGIKANSAFGLAQMGRESGIDWMLETYTNASDPTVAAALLPAMAEVGDPSYLPVFHRILQEESEYSKRYVALHGITKTGSRESLPVLQAIIDDPKADRALVTAAQKALGEISGE
ncbi:MAG: HEAT repeat domain-containing protein [bacterium]